MLTHANNHQHEGLEKDLQMIQIGLFAVIAEEAKKGFLLTRGNVDASNSTPASFRGRVVPIAGNCLNATGPRYVAFAIDGLLDAAPAKDIAFADCSAAGRNFVDLSASPLS